MIRIHVSQQKIDESPLLCVWQNEIIYHSNAHIRNDKYIVYKSSNVLQYKNQKMFQIIWHSEVS
jgi:hypothetical protein